MFVSGQPACRAGKRPEVYRAGLSRRPGRGGVIYERYQPAVYSYVYYRLGNSAQAEDLTAEGFVRMVARLHPCSPATPPIAVRQPEHPGHVRPPAR